jgi:hypothetical protein
LLRNSNAGVVLALLFAGSMWFYVSRVLAPHQRAEAAARQVPRGNLSDLYPRWLGSRELLLRRRNPYSSEITREIQAGYYGRPLDSSRPNDPKDQQAFAYPVYVAFLLAPTVRLPFEPVRTAFGWLLVTLTAASVWLWLRALQWAPAFRIGFIATVLLLGSFPAVQGIKLGQLSLLVAGLIALCAALLARGNLFAAGVVLALAAIKPQLVTVLAGCLLLWAFSDWRKRQRFVWGFGLTMLALLAGGELLLPGWMAKFWVAGQEYLRYTRGLSLLDGPWPPGLAKVASLAMLATLAVSVWRFRRVEPQWQLFPLMFGAALTVTVIVVPPASSYNQVLLLPAALLIVRDREALWRASALSKALCVVTVAVLGWQWTGALALVVASLWLPPETVQSGWKLPFYTIIWAIPCVLLFQMALLMSHAWRSVPGREVSTLQ